MLAELKTKYRDAYLALHPRVRLTANKDKKKAQIAKDSRLVQLQKLSGIVMTAQQLKDLQDSLFALKTCFAVTKPELDAVPICPHCNFRPVEEPAKGPRAGDVLAKVDDRLDELLAEWTQTLLSDLADPTVAEGIDLIDSAGQGGQGVRQGQGTARAAEQQLPEGPAGSALRPGAVESSAAMPSTRP